MNKYYSIKNSIKRIPSITILFTLTLLLPTRLLAQGELPCNDADPYNTTCPIDSGVWILAVAVIVMTVIYLKRKQRASIKGASF
jgi:hypothetical protein